MSNPEQQEAIQIIIEDKLELSKKFVLDAAIDWWYSVMPISHLTDLLENPTDEKMTEEEKKLATEVAHYKETQEKARDLMVCPVEANVRPISNKENAFTYNEELNCIIILIAYPYEIDLDRIATKSDLLGWTVHLSEKTWMTTKYLSTFVKKVCLIKGWDIKF